MRYFRELKLPFILWTNALQGFFASYFLYRAVHFALGFYHRGIFWNIIGVQLFCFVLLVTYFIDKKIWEKKRFYVAPADGNLTQERLRFVLTGVVYFAAAAVGVGIYLLARHLF